MRIFFLPIVLLLLLLATVETTAQAIYSRCNRATIASFSEQDVSPVLLYLDESRKAADEFMHLLMEGKFDELYKQNKSIKILVQGSPVIAMDLATFEQKQGRITGFEYRNQDVLWNLFSREIDLKGTIGTYYLLKTTNAKDGLVSLMIETHQGQNQQPEFEGAYFSEWVKLREKAPLWLSDAVPPIQPGNCPAINGILTVKAS